MQVSQNADNSLLAAIDLGSNSFRLEIGQVNSGFIQRVEYLKEPVRQGGDLDEDRNLTMEAMERGVRCLARFGERIQGFAPSQVRAVATQTLREANNRDVFLKMAKKALGFDVEVISGVEEARLIYQGVSRFLPQSNERRLVIDIGGRSTEFILGQGFNAQHTASLHVGSVAGGLSIMLGVFDFLNIETMNVAKGALRHGLMYDMLAQDTTMLDMRNASVLHLMRKFAVDEQHAKTVALVAEKLFEKISADTQFAAGEQAAHARKLQWASLLHEMGCMVSPIDAHLHGAYILDHAEPAGFSQNELHRLSLLVLGYRGKLKRLEADFSDRIFVMQLACLRLAVILCHARQMPNLRGLQLSAQHNSITLSLAASWAEKYPQSYYLLDEETVAWQKTNWAFTLSLA
jgi:exopolyphosphatase/pppGpp-phosphohydrolase